MTTYYFSVLLICTLVFGSIIGAYFTTAEYRIRFDKPLITKDCYCPECGHVLSGLHQIPVISWIALGGKCHYCRAKIPLRYPLIEFGFTCFYGITFLLFFMHPLFLCGLWIAAVIVLLFFRCSSHLRGTLKGILIFTGYHLIYSAVFLIIYVALGLL